jgi:hypothetical protein
LLKKRGVFCGRVEKGTVKGAKEPFSFGKNGSLGSAKGKRNRSEKGKERFP